ncbi:MAG: glycoside hydrolase family 99-like domain-containing protein [Limisphaerales bacterium]
MTESKLPAGSPANAAPVLDACVNRQPSVPPNGRNKRVVVVLGMHRSGTSLLTSLLAEAGVDLGEKLIPGDANNEAGYWEQAEINRTQDRLLHQLRKSWAGPAWMNPLPLDWRQLGAGERLRFSEELSAIVRQEMSKAKGIWGFKDPRTTRLLPLWKEVFAGLGVEPDYILAIRNPADVAASVVKRDKVTTSHAEMLWLLHNLDGIREAGDQLRLVTSYDRWFTHPQEQARAVTRALNLPPPANEDQFIEALRQRIRPDLRHWQTQRAFSVPFVAETYRLLEQAGATGRLPEELRRIDAEVDRAFRTAEGWTVLAPNGGTQQPERSPARPEDARAASTRQATGDGTVASASKPKPLARLIAFYLPQFHPIEENDRWWGKGFTEWTNVAQGTPRFAGHHQPQIPGELGFYDLRLEETRMAQADLARAHGIEAFCYWHYWFNGRRILQRPFEEALASGRPDFGFCLAWANENWTRRWDGQQNEILLKQTYGGEEDDRAHFESLLRAFRDPRAFRIDARPVFLIYRPAGLPDAHRTTDLWRELARQAGLPGIYMIAVITCFDARGADWTRMGFDAQLHFQPDFSDEMMRSATVLESTGDRVVQYAEAWPLMSRAARSASGNETLGCVTPCWDNSARRKREAVIIHNSTPAEYGRWLRREIIAVQDRPEQHRVVFINAWNEWAEGNHLEPDLKWGRAYLEETLHANEASPSAEESGEIAARGRSGPAPQAKSVEPSPGRAAPPVSVIIPVLNKIELTRKCLEALRKNTPAELCEVIVWDNGSSDGTRAFFQQQRASDDAPRYFRSEENLGFVGGNNAAARHARGRFLVFLNNDTEPQAGWLEALLGTVEASPDVGAVGAKLIYPNGQLQEAGGIIFRDASGWNYGRTEDPREPRFNFPREVDYCSAACLLVRAELFRQLGGFDPRYAPAYYEDTDLCFALRQAGYKVLYQPRCLVIHREGATAGQDLNSGFKQHQGINRQTFFDKWKTILAQQCPPNPGLARRASHRVRGQRILVIDPFLPIYDRASGSRRLFEMLKILAAAGHGLTFIARDGRGGERYAAELERLGVEVYAGDAEWMKEHGLPVNCRPFDLKKLLQDSQYDTVMLSFWYIADQYLPRIRAWSPASRVVIDTVDVHFLRERREAELCHDQKLLQQAETTRRAELGIYRQADALVTVTEDDRQALLRELPESRIFVVPNIHELSDDTPPANGREGLLFVGNFCHRPNEDGVLFFHREIWPRILQRVPGARWTIAGNNPPAAVQALAGASIQVTGYVPSLEPCLRSHLVSVAPLRYGAGMKGKIGEALAHGLPVVTTAIGAEGMGLKSGECGALVADDPETFAMHVARLYADRELWNQTSAQGRRHIASNFTPAHVGRQLETLLSWSASFTSIIVLAHNQWEHTEKCLQSIARWTPEAHEVILVDNGSTDKTSEALSELAAANPRLRVVINRDNRGFAAGNNQGLAIARGGNMVLLNNDTVVTPGWLTRLLAVLKRHPEAGIVGPMSNRVSGPQLVGNAGYTDLAQLPAFAESWAAAHDGQSFELARAVGFCLLARRQVIERIGGLDERFGSGNFEDDDFCIRAQLAGFRILAAKDAFVHHAGGQTFKAAQIDYRASLLRNWDLFKAKWAMPKDLAPENGYRLPTAPPPGSGLRIPLPDIRVSHTPSLEGRLWTDKISSPIADHHAADTSSEPAKIQLPPCALLGNLTAARELLNRNQHRPAWEATVRALTLRPFHPEAHLLLAKIALAAGAGEAARQCAQRARQLVPEWSPARQFLNGRLRGKAMPRWLALPAAPAAAPRLSVCLIVKNEEEFLGQCLASVRGLAAQIVVVDTGSTDRTAAIAGEHGAEVHQFAWCDDFSAARNAALEYATGDWVLVLDADEELPAGSHEPLRRLMRDKSAIAWRLPIIDAGREDEGCSYVPRLFRNAPALFFVGRVHEQIFSSLEVRRRQWGLENRLGDAPLRHHGYRPEIVNNRNKIERNLRLLERAVAEMPGEPNLLMSYGLELARSGQRERGVTEYFRAFHLMSAQPASMVVPELRETLLTQLASQLTALKRWDDLARLLNSPLAQAGGLTASLHFALGLAHLEQKQFCEAADQMRQCLAKRDQPALAPINKEIHQAGPRHCLALCLDQMCQPDAAAQEFRGAIEDDPKSRPARLDYAAFQAAHGEPVQALNLYRALAKEMPDDPQAWLRGGRLALSTPQFGGVALDWTSEAQRRLPGHPTVVQQRAEALTLAGQCEPALPLWRRLAASLPLPAQARAIAALVLCETVSGQNVTAPPAALETLVSREFVAWYQRLVRFNARTAVLALNDRVEMLRSAIPTGARLLAAALAQAQAAPCR